MNFYDIGYQSGASWRSQPIGGSAPDLNGMLHRAHSDGVTTTDDVNAWVAGWCDALQCVGAGQRRTLHVARPHSPSAIVAIIMRDDGNCIASYSDDELDTHREMHDLQNWPYTVFRRETSS